MGETKEGIVIRCEVKPKAKAFSVAWAESVLNISVTAMAVEGRANKEVLETIHGIFRRPKSQIKIIGGSKSKSKSVLIEEMTKEEAMEQILRLSQD